MGVKINISTEKALNEEIVEEIENTMGVSDLPIQIRGDINNMTVDMDVGDLTEEQETTLKQRLENVFVAKGKKVTSLSFDIPARRLAKMDTSNNITDLSNNLRPGDYI